MSLLEEYHKRSDHGRDGAPMDSFTCNCREVIAKHNDSILAPIVRAVEEEESQGYSVYMRPIRRALQGKSIKKRKKPVK